jgi:thioesterase domain-containing protein
MLLFRRTEFLSGRSLDPAFGWGELVKGGLEVCSIQCGHQDLFDTENVGRIAEMLRSRLYGLPPNLDHSVLIQPVNLASK